jgi:hypothetical protein
MSARRSPAEAPAAVARAPRPRASAPPRPAQDLAAAARAVGAEVSSGPDFMEISFPSPPGAAHASVARTPAPAAPVAPAPWSASAHPAANAPRALGGGAAIARTASSVSIARSTTGGSSSGRSAGDSVVAAVLRALREENEHLGSLDGIDPLF